MTLMRTILLLLLAIALPAYAAPPLPPLPTVKRTAPLLSPRAASVPKSVPMFVPASENPPVPMTAYFEEVNDAFGKYKLTAELIQPPGHATLFEYSATVGNWHVLAWFGPDPVWSQQISAYIHCDGPSVFIRATLTPMVVSAAETRVVRSSTGVVAAPSIAIKVADVRGAGASATRLR